MMAILRNLTVDELSQLINRYPMTVSGVTEVIRNDVDSMKYSDVVANTTILASGINGKYDILVSSHCKEEAQKDQIVHKLAHIFYECTIMNKTNENLFSEDAAKLEKMIEKEAAKFYSDNFPFIDKLYSALPLLPESK